MFKKLSDKNIILTKYETKLITNGDFKRFCINYNLNPDDFIRVKKDIRKSNGDILYNFYYRKLHKNNLELINSHCEIKQQKFFKEDYGFVIDCKVCSKKTRLRWYKTWDSLIRRCYDTTYSDYMNIPNIEFPKEWKIASKFKKWFEINNPKGDLVIQLGFETKNKISIELTKFISKKDHLKKFNVFSPRNPKEMNYYETHSITRTGFLTKCHRSNKNITNYIEIFSGKYHKKTKLNYYFEIDKYRDNEDIMKYYKPPKFSLASVGCKVDCPVTYRKK